MRVKALREVAADSTSQSRKILFIIRAKKNGRCLYRRRIHQNYDWHNEFRLFAFEL